MDWRFRILRGVKVLSLKVKRGRDLGYKKTLLFDSRQGKAVKQEGF